MSATLRSTTVPELAARVQTATRASGERFERALAHPERAQLERLAAVLSAAAGSTRARGIAGLDFVRTAREFQDAVPPCTADQLEPDIERIAAGESAVLTRAPVLWFERSGGTSGAFKRVPYTAQLLEEFQSALLPWVFDLARGRPRAWSGPGYWSVSPLAQEPEVTRGGLSIGGAGDGAYFPERLMTILSPAMAVPADIARLPDVESCRYVTLRLLLEREQLAFISAWNPSFLTLLMQELDGQAAALLEDLERGECRPPRLEATGRRGSIAPLARDARVAAIVGRIGFSAQPQRARALRAVLEREGRLPATALWPELALISAWADAQAQRALAAMSARFPGVEIQGKGLLASEGVVSIPWLEAAAPVLAVRSHFLEFIDVDSPEARPLLAHALEAGRAYEVMISTGSGLLRYRLGDRVRVEGHYAHTPCVRFEGRADAVSDLVGEKLSASRVSAVLARLIPRTGGGPVPRFVMLAPEWGTPPEYRLYVECEAAGDVQLEKWSRGLEAELLAGFPYRYARELGQLGPVRVVRVDDGERRYEARCVMLGQRAGDVKPPDLDRRTDWSKWMSAAEPRNTGPRDAPATAAPRVP